jgi:hypothetical protein
MQHDVFSNPNRRMRRAYPYLVVLQSDLVEGPDRVIAPLVPPRPDGSVPKGLPIVEHGGSRYILVLTLLGSIHATRFPPAVGSLQAYRDDITRGLDWIFLGI